MATIPPANPVGTPRQENTTDPLYRFAHELCTQPANRFGPDFFEEHLLVVERFALKLAELFHADREIARAAALLHDMAAIRDFSCLPNHAEKGAEEIASLLSSHRPAGGFGFDTEHISRIAVCVREHSSPRRSGETTVESVCVSNADAMSQITRPFYWFHYARTLKCLTHRDAIEWYRALVCRNWSNLVDEARSLIEGEYMAVEVMLRPT